jgi:hypothetical protein
MPIIHSSAHLAAPPHQRLFAAAAAPLRWATHSVRDESGAVIENVCTSLDVKGLHGSDKRKYALELTQLFPKDAGWIASGSGSGSGSGSAEDDKKSASSTSASSSSSSSPSATNPSFQMRPELVEHYVRRRVRTQLKAWDAQLQAWNADTADARGSSSSEGKSERGADAAVDEDEADLDSDAEDEKEGKDEDEESNGDANEGRDEAAAVALSAREAARQRFERAIRFNLNAHSGRELVPKGKKTKKAEDAATRDGDKSESDAEDEDEEEGEAEDEDHTVALGAYLREVAIPRLVRRWERGGQSQARSVRVAHRDDGGVMVGSLEAVWWLRDDVSDGQSGSSERL